jgi:hypothetical protein
MEPSEEPGGLPMEVDAWEKEASLGPASRNVTRAGRYEETIRAQLEARGAADASGRRVSEPRASSRAVACRQHGDAARVLLVRAAHG